MSLIAAVRVRVEREGGRGVQKKKRESKGRSKHTLQYVYVCFTLFFSLLSFSARRSFFFFFCCCVCALQGQQALTSHSLTRVTAHVTFKTKRPSKKNPNKPKTKKTQPWFCRTRRSAAVTRESVALTFHLVTLQIETLQHKAKKVSN